MRFDIDLLRPERKREIRFRLDALLSSIRPGTILPFLILMIIFLLIYAAIYLPREKKINIMRYEAQSMSRKTEALKKQVELTKQKIDVLLHVKKEELPVSDIKRAIASVIPSDAWIEKLEISSKEGKLTIYGSIYDEDGASLLTLARFMEGLCKEKAVASEFYLEDWLINAKKEDGRISDFEIKMVRRSG